MAASRHLDDAAYLLGIVGVMLEALLGLGDLVDRSQGPLGNEPAQRELDVVTRSAHRRGDRDAVHLDLQGLLDGEGVRSCVDGTVAPAQHAAPIGRGHPYPFAGGRLSLGVECNVRRSS